MERVVLVHGVTHRVLHDGLHDEAGHHDFAAALLDAHALDDAVLAEARLLDVQVALRLLDLGGQRDERLRVLERPPVEHGELAQQVTGLGGVGARERRDGVERVE